MHSVSCLRGFTEIWCFLFQSHNHLIQSFFREAVMLAAVKPADLNKLAYVSEPYITKMSENCQIQNK